jgi:hypothetical protein
LKSTKDYDPRQRGREWTRARRVDQSIVLIFFFHIETVALSRKMRPGSEKHLEHSAYVKETKVAMEDDYSELASALARRLSAVVMAMAPSRIMAPIGAAASSGSTSAIHTTRLPPISRG